MKKNLIPQNLNYLMKLNSLSVRKLFELLESERVISTQKQLAAWKEGINEPNIDCIKVLAKFFKLSIDDFCFTDLSSTESK